METTKTTKIKTVKLNSFELSSLDKVKVGHTVWIVMTRHNPQLGTYHTFEAAVVGKVTKAAIYTLNWKGELTDNPFMKKNRSTKKHESCIYGSAYYKIYTHSELVGMINDGHFKGEENKTDKVLNFTIDSETTLKSKILK